MGKWLIYTFFVGFAVYWVSNLVLWIPWSISEVLGITLMLTVSPVIWAFAVFLCLSTYPGKQLSIAAIYTSMMLVAIAVISDYLFFGLIRNAEEELYHPTTFYGYFFVLIVPFIEILLFRKFISRKKRKVTRGSMIPVILTALICIGLLFILISTGLFTDLQ